MNILNKIEELKYERDRTKYLSKVIQKIGTIEESDSCITCYVQQDLLEKKAKIKDYVLQCNGMNTANEQSRKLVDYFKLNKSVYYIFDGIYFDRVVYISSSFSNIIFRNCTFNGGIRISFADTIILEKNEYNSFSDFKEYGNAFLYGKVKNLEIKNEQFVNNFNSQHFDNNFGINIEADKVKINNSKVYARNNGQVNIKAKETYIWNSDIRAPEIYLDSDNITIDHCLLKTKEGLLTPTKVLLKAKNGIIIENKNCDLEPWVRFLEIDSPYKIYNGTEIISISDEFKDEKLKEKRLALVQVLTNVINKRNQKNLVK